MQSVGSSHPPASLPTPSKLPPSSHPVMPLLPASTLMLITQDTLLRALEALPTQAWFCSRYKGYLISTDKKLRHRVARDLSTVTQSFRPAPHPSNKKRAHSPNELPRAGPPGLVPPGGVSDLNNQAQGASNSAVIHPPLLKLISTPFSLASAPLQPRSHLLEVSPGLLCSHGQTVRQKTTHHLQLATAA